MAKLSFYKESGTVTQAPTNGDNNAFVYKKDNNGNVVGWLSDTGGTYLPIGIAELDWSIVTMSNQPTTLSGYGITDAYTETEVDNITGDLINLTTNSKTNLVSAINELNTAIADGMKPPNPIDCSTNPAYPAANAGETWKVTVGGKIGGSNGELVEPGDLIICMTDSAGGSQATAGGDFFIVNTNIDSATESVEGTGRIATTQEVANGTNDFAWVTPLKLDGALGSYYTKSYLQGKDFWNISTSDINNWDNKAELTDIKDSTIKFKINGSVIVDNFTLNQGTGETIDLGNTPDTQLSDEEVQDIIGGILTNEFNYNDNANEIGINSIAASKITGLNNVATTGNYSDLNGLPGLTVSSGLSINNSTVSTLASGNANNLDLDFNYLDSRYLTGFKQQEAVVAATNTNISLSGLQTIDGVTLTAGDRVLVMGQTNAADNGIYEAASGSWSRASDFDQATTGEIEQGASVFVESGTNLGNTSWVLQTGGTIVVGTTDLIFIQSSGSATYTAGVGLTKSGAIFSLRVATTTQLGGIKVGDRLSIDGSGKLSADKAKWVDIQGKPTIPTQYTDENAQDAIGSIFDNTLTYDDATPKIGVDTTKIAERNWVNDNFYKSLSSVFSGDIATLYGNSYNNSLRQVGLSAINRPNGSGFGSLFSGKGSTNTPHLYINNIGDAAWIGRSSNSGVVWNTIAFEDWSNDKFVDVTGDTMTGTLNIDTLSEAINILDNNNQVEGSIKWNSGGYVNLAFNWRYHHNEIATENQLFSGDYNDLTNTPTIPTVNNSTITINTGAGLDGGGTFKLNQANNKTFNLNAVWAATPQW